MESREWYYVIGGEQRGPIAEDELGNLLARGHVQPDDLVWSSGMQDWCAARDVPELWASAAAPAGAATVTPPAILLSSESLPPPSAEGIRPHPLAITSLVLAIACFACFGPVSPSRRSSAVMWP